MKSSFIFTVASFALVTMLLTLGVGSVNAAATPDPMLPDLAAKGNRVKTQQSQKITQAQRQAAADALKAERLKLHQGQHGGQTIAPTTPAPQ